MSFTAFAAGHLLGGAIWQVLTPDEEQVGILHQHGNKLKQFPFKGVVI